MGVEEMGNDLVGLSGFRQVDVIPERMWQSLKDNELSVGSCLEEGTMQDRGSAEEQVASAGDEEGWWHAAQISVDGREDGVFGIGVADIFGVMHSGHWRREIAGQAPQRIHCLRVSCLAEVAHAREDAHGSGKREAQLLKLYGGLG